MFLGNREIRHVIETGDVVIEPFDDSAISAHAVDLHLGTQFLTPRIGENHGVYIDPTRPQDKSPLGQSLERIGDGDRFVVAPGGSVICISREFVHMPNSLIGLLFPISALEQLGLVVSSGQVSPRFQGKLAFLVRNMNARSFVLHADQRIMRLSLAHISGPNEEPDGGPVRPIGTLTSGEDGFRQQKIISQQEEMRGKGAKKLIPNLPERLAVALAADSKAKGKLLEQLIEDIFTSLAGLVVMKRNARLRSEEIDLLIKNNLATGFWRLAGSPIVVECKNWSGKVGAREISVLVEKLQALGPDARTGILVSPSGITGGYNSDAVLKVREARQRGRYILIFNRKDLEELADGASLGDMVEKKYDETILI